MVILLESKAVGVVDSCDSGWKCRWGRRAGPWWLNKGGGPWKGGTPWQVVVGRMGRCQVLWGCLDKLTCCWHLVMLVVVAVKVHVLSSFCHELHIFVHNRVIHGSHFWAIFNSFSTSFLDCFHCLAVKWLKNETKNETKKVTVNTPNGEALCHFWAFFWPVVQNNQFEVFLMQGVNWVNLKQYSEVVRKKISRHPLEGESVPFKLVASQIWVKQIDITFNLSKLMRVLEEKHGVQWASLGKKIARDRRKKARPRSGPSASGPFSHNLARTLCGPVRTNCSAFNTEQLLADHHLSQLLIC